MIPSRILSPWVGCCSLHLPKYFLHLPSIFLFQKCPNLFTFFFYLKKPTPPFTIHRNWNPFTINTFARFLLLSTLRFIKFYLKFALIKIYGDLLVFYHLFFLSHLSLSSSRCPTTLISIALYSTLMNNTPPSHSLTVRCSYLRLLCRLLHLHGE